MSSIRTLIVDDEPLARERLRALLRGEEAIEIVGECATGEEALASIQHDSPDLVFLDLQLAGSDGLQVVARLPADRRPAIVFATAHERYAIEAFGVGAVDYLLKPFDAERLQLAVQRVRQHLQARVSGTSRPARAEGGGAPRNERLAFRTDGRIVFLRPHEITWIEADDNYVVLHLPSSRLTLRDTLTAIEARLDPTQFVRVSRSAIVQIDQIKELQPAPHGDYTVILRDATKLPLSRSLRGRLDQLARGRA